MRKCSCFCVWILCFIFITNTQAVDFDQRIFEAKEKMKTGFNTWNPQLLKQARDIFLNLLVKESGNNRYLIYYIALSDYRLTTYYIASNRPEDAENCIQDGKKYLEKAMKTNPSIGELDALYASLLGYEIALHQEKGMVLGMKIYQYFAQAFKKSPNNPRVNLLKGLSVFYTPETYGGGANNALEYLEKSVDLFAKEIIKNRVEPSWGEEDAYTYLGMVYKQKKEFTKAKVYFKKALQLNPDFFFAVKELSEIGKE